MALNESNDEVLPIGEELVKILPEMRLFARSRTYSVHDADDLVSKSCVRILERQSQYEPGTSFIAWAITILRNIHVDEIRAKGRQRQTTDSAEVAVAVDPLSLRRIESKAEISEVHRAIHQLPEEQREVLVLMGGGFTYEEIVLRLNIPKGTVMSRLHRGRRALEELMGRP